MDFLYEIFFIHNFHLTIGMIFLLFLGYSLYKNLNKILNHMVLHPKIANNVDAGTTNKYKKLDNKCYDILYKVYNLIGATINIDNSEIFEEQYLLKLNEAKKIFYGVKRNKNLVKSNYLIVKIMNKIKSFEINSDEIDDTVIYLIVLVLNKKNK
jgi:hypothetical protein